MRIDHVIYAAGHLDAVAARLEAEYGLQAVAGGRHEGLGTENRIVPLGGGYLEIIGIADPKEAVHAPLGRGVMKRLRAGDGLMGWAVAVDDVEAVAERLGTRVLSISRTGLTARMTGADEAMAVPLLPYFISRDPGIADPGDGGDAAGIAWVELSGDAGRLEGWLGGAQLPVRVVDGPPGVRGFGVAYEGRDALTIRL